MPQSSSSTLVNVYRPIAVLMCTAAVTMSAAAQHQHAHSHGQLSLDVAIDKQSISLSISSPLDSFLGFERAPRNDAERKRVTELEAQLNAADVLLQPDPTAECKLSNVTMASEALDLDTTAERAGNHEHGHGRKDAHGHSDEHADIDISVVFTCADTRKAKFIDVKLFDAYKRIHTINAQIAVPGKQFKQSLRPGTPRLNLTR